MHVGRRVVHGDVVVMFALGATVGALAMLLAVLLDEALKC
jgi:hypothetical protein